MAGIQAKLMGEFCLNFEKFKAKFGDVDKEKRFGYIQNIMMFGHTVWMWTT